MGAAVGTGRAVGTGGTTVTGGTGRAGTTGGTAVDRVGRTPYAEMGLRNRIALLCATGVGIAVVLAATASFFVVRHQLSQESDRSLIARTTGAASAGPLSVPSTVLSISPAALGAADVRIGLLSAAGVFYISAGTDLEPGLPEERVAAGLAASSIRTEAIDGVDYRVAAAPTGRGSALILARSLADQEAVLQQVARIATLIGAAGVLVAAFAGYSVARAGLAPVRRLTAAAERVARTNELTPVPVPPGPAQDELARLAAAFNTMLAALSDTRESERRLVADAGHELRTPLTSMRTNLDLLVQAEALAGDPDGARLSATDRTELLADLHAQTGELADLVGDLVELSRGGIRESGAVVVDLAEVVEQACVRAGRRGPEIRLDVTSAPFAVLADPASLERAVVNVVDNAIRWTPAGGTVTVVQAGGTVTVDDTGPGFAPEDLPHVFDRFYRAPSARGLPGSGLGLAIVAQVAARHAGRVTAGRAPGGGARVVLVLPPAPVPAAVPARAPAPAAVTTGHR